VPKAGGRRGPAAFDLLWAAACLQRLLDVIHSCTPLHSSSQHSRTATMSHTVLYTPHSIHTCVCIGGRRACNASMRCVGLPAATPAAADSDDVSSLPLPPHSSATLRCTAMRTSQRTLWRTPWCCGGASRRMVRGGGVGGCCLLLHRGWRAVGQDGRVVAAQCTGAVAVTLQGIVWQPCMPYARGANCMPAHSGCWADHCCAHTQPQH
jgi:hypothetical protein